MSCSKPVPPFIFDSLYYLNRDQLERFSIVCRPLTNFINRYFQSMPYRLFDRLQIRGRSYVLFHNFNVQWHPNREDYSVQQFLAGQKCSCDELKGDLDDFTYYSFAEMRPYLGSTVSIEWTTINVDGNTTYNPEEVEQMESLAHLWRDGKITIWNSGIDLPRIRPEDFQPILNSPTILQCRILELGNAVLSFKDYKVLHEVKVIETTYFENEFDLGRQYWQQFLEKPGVKPVIAFQHLRRKNIDNLLDRLIEAFSSAVLSNAFKVVFSQHSESLTEFRKVNNNSGEILALKKGLPSGYKEEYLEEYNNYTLERSTI